MNGRPRTPFGVVRIRSSRRYVVVCELTTTEGILYPASGVGWTDDEGEARAWPGSLAGPWRSSVYRVMDTVSGELLPARKAGDPTDRESGGECRGSE